MAYVTVFDFETTGLSPNAGDRVIEVGAVKLDGNSVIGVFDSLVNPGRLPSKRAQDITGITNEMVLSAPDSKTVFTQFADFLEDDLLVIHNVAFDSAFLKHEFELCNIQKTYEYYCTLKTARKKIEKSPNYRLATLKNFLQLHMMGNMHRALADAFVTAQLYLSLEKQLGVDTINLMERMFKQYDKDQLENPSIAWLKK